mgnify:FL=1
MHSKHGSLESTWPGWCPHTTSVHTHVGCQPPVKACHCCQDLDLVLLNLHTTASTRRGIWASPGWVLSVCWGTSGTTNIGQKAVTAQEARTQAVVPHHSHNTNHAKAPPPSTANPHTHQINPHERAAGQLLPPCFSPPPPPGKATRPRPRGARARPRGDRPPRSRVWA